MQTFSKVLVYAVLACLLLSGVNASRRAYYRAQGENHFGRERHRATARLRRCRQDNPAHHPVRPCKNAVLPPDEDDDDGERDRFSDSLERLLSPCHDPASRAVFPTVHCQPLPTDVPRYQTLCILLI